MGKLTRRELLGQSAFLVGASASALPMLDAAGEHQSAAGKKLKIVVTGGHPDDPESGCGGTIALYSSRGHDVVILYLTRGEAGIEGKSAKESAEIRTAESRKACEILKARPLFAGQIDGSTEVNSARYKEFRQLLEAERPDVVLTHWPIDSHRDHRAASLLTYDAWLDAGRKFDLYFYEVDQGEQTQVFHPTHYVDITQTESQKRAACSAHVSQQPETSFYVLHDAMNRFRGMEFGVKYAEAFVRHTQNPPKAILSP
ncbi:MAG TPA: PIG-L family deacetylase [Candidatus Limnocylindrales bacterium]|nr:PIG-L family deacetylase [Candidatus Limnocylindrales bacterium]